MTLKGCTVEVVRGRKVPVGTIGVVIWVGEAAYGPAPRFHGGWYRQPTQTRIGVKDAAGTVHWTATNCEVKAPAPEAVPAAPFVPAPEAVPAAPFVPAPEAVPAAPFVPAAGFTKGTEVITAEGPGKIFWVGPDKRNAGATRLGVKLAANGATVWAGTAEVALPGADEATECAGCEHCDGEGGHTVADSKRAYAATEFRAPAYEPGPAPLPTTGAAMAWAAKPGKAA